jgi:predicted site-specific integrase-resolvase
MQHQSPRPAPSVASFLRSAAVAAIVQVFSKITRRWAQVGRLPFRRTPGGHRRPSSATMHQLAASLVQEVRDR